MWLYDVSLNVRFATAGLIALFSIGFVRLNAVKAYDRFFGKPSALRDGLAFWILAWIAVAILSGLASSNLTGVMGVALVAAASLGIFVVDVRYQVIPDRLQIMATLGAACILVASKSPFEHIVVVGLYAAGSVLLLGCATYFYERYRKKPAMGWGDIKLIGWSTLLVGSNVMYFLLIACLLGAAYSLSQFALKKKIEPFAFAPALLFALTIINICF